MYHLFENTTQKYIKTRDRLQHETQKNLPAKREGYLLVLKRNILYDPNAYIYLIALGFPSIYIAYIVEIVQPVYISATQFKPS